MNNKYPTIFIVSLFLVSLGTWIPLLALKVTNNTYLYEIATCGPVEFYECGMVTGCLFGVKCQYTYDGQTFGFNHKCFDRISFNCEQNYQNGQYIGIYVLNMVKNKAVIAGIAIAFAIFICSFVFLVVKCVKTYKITSRAGFSYGLVQ